MLKKAPSEMKDVDLNEIVRSTILILSPLASARQVDFNPVIFSEPLLIRGDQVQVQQVVVNLIVNAMDAMSGTASAERKRKCRWLSACRVRRGFRLRSIALF
jgi:C4-dicarboxylate-specific signal transduction histidine kinase